MIEYPRMLWLLLVLVPVAAILVRRYVTGARDVRALVGSWRRLSYENAYVVKWFFSSLTFLLFLGAGVLSTAGLRWGQIPISQETSGHQTVIAVDVSRSMLAEDVAPSRIARTSAVLRTLVERSQGSQYAVVVFKGSAVVGVPMTEDTPALAAFLDALSPDMLTASGTDLEAGLDAALDAFPGGTQASKSVILVSDGGYLSGNPSRAADRAREESIVVHTVGAGTRTSVPIPIGNDAYVTDTNGNVVETRLQDDVLTDLAERASGTYIRLDDPRISTLLADLAVGADRHGAYGYRFDLQSRYRLFVLLALLFLAMSISIRIVRWRETL